MDVELKGRFPLISRQNNRPESISPQNATVHRKTKKIRLITKVSNEGALTPYLSSAKPTTWVNISAPKGNFTLPNTDKPVLMVAGGSGITPFIAMLEDAIENKQLSDHTNMVEAQVYFNMDEKIEVGDQWSLRNWQAEFGDVSRRVAIEFMQLHNLSDEINLLMEYENIYSRVFKN